ncbi:hypothetical protein IG195_00470 [Arthrobacter sp. TES]|nr:hypothetical protein IG195_00470 [Arthrobacter sp. TES]
MGILDNPISVPLKEALDSKANKGELMVNVRDYGAVGNGSADDTIAVQNAVSAAFTASGTVFWPKGSYKTTASITNLHKVTHAGGGAVIRNGNTFKPALGYTDTNTFYVDPAGSSTADGLSATEPMNRLSTAFTAFRVYGPVLQGNWAVQLAAGTYNDQAITGQRSLNRIQIYGAPVAAGTQPTTVFTPGGTGFTKAIAAQGYVSIGLTNIAGQGYTAAETPTFDFVAMCDVVLTNVWAQNGDMGFRFMNHTKYAASGIVSENHAQYGILELFSVVRDFKLGGMTNPSILRGNTKVGIKAKELCTGHLDYTQIYNNKHGVHFSRSCTANGTSASIYKNQYGVTLRNQSSFVALGVDWKFGTADINTVTPWDVEHSCSFVTNENEAISTSVFTGRGERLLGSFAPEPAYSLTGTTATTTFCTFGNLRQGSLARPGGYVRTVIFGSKGGTGGTITIDFRFGGSSAGTIVLPATAVVFRIEVLVFSRGMGKQTVFATESLAGAALQRVDRTYDVNVADYLLSARATMAVSTDSLTINGAWCYTTEALADES